MNIWARLGISVAFSAAFYIVMMECLQSTRSFEAYKWQACVGLLGAGLLLWFFGARTNVPPPASESPPADGPTPVSASAGEPAEPVASPGLFNLRYCGCMLMVFGVIVLAMMPTSRQALAKVAHAVKSTTPTRSSEKDSALNLKLQGIIYRPSRPSALINGETLFVGESVAGAKVLSISMTAVTIDRNGARSILALPN
jgi:MSHA biogenesis protein MshK